MVGVWSWLLITNVFDVFATKYLITRGYAREVNPFAKWLIDISGYHGLLAFKLIFVVALLIMVLLYVRKTHTIPRIVYFIVILYTILVVYQSIFLVHVQNI